MQIYLIPGLGFDCRIFQKLDFKHNQVHHINWIEPKRKEHIRDYAIRMLGKAQHSQEKVVLIGHSLGGIIAQEYAVTFPVEKVILISSIQSRNELPMLFKSIAPLGLQYTFTKGLCINTVQYWGKQHGYETSEEVTLFKSMVGSYSNTYLRWALKALSTWQTPAFPHHQAIHHIHGTHDKTFPFKLIKRPGVTISGGGHFMVFKRSDVVNDALREELKKI